MEEEKIARISHYYEQILKELGFDSDADSELRETPRRVAEFYLEIFSSPEAKIEPEITVLERGGNTHEMILLTDMPFYSMCVHHFLPFYGRASIAYVPLQKMIGISSIGRLVEYYSRRPQLQERLTEAIADHLYRSAGASGVIVMLEGRQLCMEMRGPRKSGVVRTTAARGCFEEKSWREEFFRRLGR